MNGKRTLTYTACIAILAGAAVMPSNPAEAGVSADEAAQLKTTLTPTGAIRAGNADGTIPAWDGGYKATAGTQDETPLVYASEKPLFSITKDNVAKYADKLTAGTKYLVEKYDGFRVDVYPTHRSYAAPQWVYDNTFKNATTARLENDGQTVSGAIGGIPFPIPKTGVEAVWNHLLHFRGVDRYINAVSWFVTADGKRSVANSSWVWETFPYYYQAGRKSPFDKMYSRVARVVTKEPAYQNGETLLLEEPIDYSDDNRIQAWLYLTGQRRLRKSPEAAYDTPFPYTSGISNFDDLLGFIGDPDRYEWKLVGRKEFFVPYNDNVHHVPESSDKVVLPRYVSPDYSRWELHRVWVVDATLKAGMRHVVPHRTFYIDEDSWEILVADEWDAKGQFWKTQQNLLTVAPKAGTSTDSTSIFYDVQSGAYAAFNFWNEPKYKGMKFEAVKDEDFFTPDSVAAQGVN